MRRIAGQLFAARKYFSILIFYSGVIFALMKKTYLSKIFWFIILLAISNKNFSQNPLPDFSVSSAGKNKSIISWTNTYPNLVQVSVQRSYDSLRNFQTIFSAQSPELPSNGFADNNVVPPFKYFYRIFYVFEDGRYFFTKSKSVFTSTDNFSLNNLSKSPRVIIAKKDSVSNDLQSGITKKQPEKFFYVYNRTKDSLLCLLDTVNFIRFRDSVITKTKDTLEFLSNTVILLKRYVSLIWKPSMYLFTNDAGNLKIKLPQANIHKYRIKILDETGSELFEIKNITDNELFLEKGNFFHAGWFGFELYEDDKLKEKNKFYLQKVF